MKVLQFDNLTVFQFSPAQGGADRCVLFSHATGIAALTYEAILQRWADEVGAHIFAFDARGHGDNTHATKNLFKGNLTQIPWQMCEDLKQLFNTLKARFPGIWSLAGHSLGGWLSLYAAKDVDVENVILLDMPLLAPSSALLWATACFFKQRGIHPLSRPARGRKRLFRSRRQALTTFQRNSFFRNWDEKHIQNYIDANFKSEPDGMLRLKHDPQWEADLFESQPALHTPHFLKISTEKRQQLRVELITGTESKICHPRAVPYFRRFFPRTRWFVVPEGAHMFPFENTRGLIQTLKVMFQKEKREDRNGLDEASDISSAS